MILKSRTKPRIILQLEALLPRIPNFHPTLPLITEDYNKRMAGYKGEQSVDYPLSYLDEKNYFIFHHLRLKTDKHFFQMDTLIFTNKMAIILEIKNFSGTIYFDPKFKQLIQTKDGKELAYAYPLTQLDRQKANLKEWLRINKLEDIAIQSLVVISNPYTIISTSPEDHHIHHTVIHKEELPNKILQLEKSKITNKLEEKALRKIFKLLLKKHTEGDASILEKYDIKESDLLKGVFCPKCSVLPMDRLKGNWFCPYCGEKNKHAHVKAVKDYRLLIKSTISNRELRDFLKFDSADTATRLFQTMNLRSTGKNKTRIYFLDSLENGKR
ncbi:NERD domain-containing protein [Metabacillus litoralis]|uniref:nuclease-related domain-containing protein n=1 Tax=Metabacillus TaxID=2675233 RepID=UPI001BA02F48|nr:nuclease-related domain-containing protein [Metabacillus litoralis]UHA61758.1 NERD domain-containing protein [Metabacillus litoralis]